MVKAMGGAVCAAGMGGSVGFVQQMRAAGAGEVPWRCRNGCGEQAEKHLSGQRCCALDPVLLFRQYP
ncbi:MAG: hypothetical protein KDI81_16050, partial [Xanthomonadales bacterium]|nr:hypothetical protein [Xanthomonadales bacterium]